MVKQNRTLLSQTIYEHIITAWESYGGKATPRPLAFILAASNNM